MYWTPEKIKALRQCYRMTQTEFGERIGLSTSHVCNLEAGKKIPNRQTQIILDTVERGDHYYFSDSELLMIDKTLRDALYFLSVNGSIKLRLECAIRFIEEKVK